jgi:hypothetical protein
MGEGGKHRPDALTVPVSGNGVEKRFKGDGMRGRVISEPLVLFPLDPSSRCDSSLNIMVVHV